MEWIVQGVVYLSDLLVHNTLLTLREINGVSQIVLARICFELLRPLPHSVVSLS
jgi:hypothetical protein